MLLISLLSTLIVSSIDLQMISQLRALLTLSKDIPWAFPYLTQGKCTQKLLIPQDIEYFRPSTCIAVQFLERNTSLICGLAHLRKSLDLMNRKHRSRLHDLAQRFNEVWFLINTQSFHRRSIDIAQVFLRPFYNRTLLVQVLQFAKMTPYI